MKMIRLLLFFFLLFYSALARNNRRKPHPGKKWLTLNGAEPLVVARGGFSGLFPDSSENAYGMAQQISLRGTIMYCDLQLTKGGEGFCQSQINLENSTDISEVFPNERRVYDVNGKRIRGWFGLDFGASDLFGNVTLTQNIYSRPSIFDGASILTPLDIVATKKPPRIWINVQYNMFYNQKNLHPETYIESVMGNSPPDYISSPEIGFLKDIATRIQKNRTKLIFRFVEANAIEPTTQEKYSSVLKSLSGIKSFASGILVPKEYIWPVSKDGYLQPATTLVPDAHKEGLEVYASGFANDNILSYNYSYDPTREYLQFIDNTQFSIDGVLTDYPSTASESIACLAQSRKSSRILNTLIISHDGASGDYPGSTDLAYQKAIDDGADIIDCSVQMSQDGVPFCLDSADLTATTTAATTFMERSTIIPEIQKMNGIFSFDLTWSEIRSLRPQILNPVDKGLPRNPANKNKGKFVSLSEFLELAKSKAVSGILINIDNAAFLAAKKGLDIVGAASTALSNAKLDKQSTKKVMIQSDDSSVLLKFKNVPTYQRVLDIQKDVGGASDEIAHEVKKYADAISVRRGTIIQDYPREYFSKDLTNIIPSMHAANISVYAGVFRNEFMNFLFDYFADPYVELATFVAAGVDGVVTDFPATANAYMRSVCADLDAKLPYTIMPARAGDLFSFAAQYQMLAPAPAPAEPPLSTVDVADPPLPPVTNSTTPPNSASASSATTPPPADADAAPKASNSARTASRGGLGFLVAMVGYLNLV